MKKWMLTCTASMLCMLLFAGMACAHVTVYPKETTQGAYEKFTVRVPTEKDVPTVKVEVKIPDDAEISRVEPKPGWKYEFVKDSTGKITSVIWTATDAGLGPTEFGEFNMQGKVGDKASSLAWKAHQTYKDGTVVDWVGSEGSEHPASVTKVKEKAAGDASHSDEHGKAASGNEAAGGAEADNGSSNVPLYLSIAALALGLFSLMVSLRRRVG